MSLTVHLALVFHIFIAVAVTVMVCGRHGTGPEHEQVCLVSANTEFILIMLY